MDLGLLCGGGLFCGAGVLCGVEGIGTVCLGGRKWAFLAHGLILVWGFQKFWFGLPGPFLLLNFMG